MLRFDSTLPVQSWGFQASAKPSSPSGRRRICGLHIPRDVPAPIPFFGRLEGLGGLKGAGALELQPFVLGSARRRDASQTLRQQRHRQQRLRFGLDLKWHIAQDLTFDAALNPDFSQVELDQIILNLSTYETFLPEKRPFFLEGIDALLLPDAGVLFTAGSAARAAGAVATERRLQQRWSWGGVPTPATIYGTPASWSGASVPTGRSARSARSPPPTTSLIYDNVNATTTERLAAPTSAFNVLRLKRELGAGGHIGIIGTGSSTYESDGGYPVLGKDGFRELCPSGATPLLGSSCFHDAYVGGVDWPLAFVVGRLRRQRRSSSSPSFTAGRQ